ncbi:MAG: DUF1501 domain-containing protein [Planctomycetia bacterium]|nr:DUF1501 domain-containing protein [Planctomycetia bacterium]
MATTYRTDCEGFHRRDFLKIGAASLFGLNLPDLLRLEAQAKTEGRSKKATSVIMLWLAGGPATIDMWDLKPNAPETIRGEFKPIDTKAAGIQISEHLPKMADVMDKCTIVRSVHHTIPNHGPGTVWMTTGNKPTPALQYPSLGSVASRLLPADVGVPPYVTFSDLRNGAAGGAGYLGTAYNPFTVEGAGGRAQGEKGGGNTLRVRGITLPNGFTLEELDNRDQLLQAFDSHFKTLDKSSDLAEGLDAFHKQALEILRSDKTKKAFNLNQEKQSLRDDYGTSGAGLGALAARRLVQAGVRFVTVSIGGWDTHQGTFTSHKSRLQPETDRVLATLIKDLSDQGMLDSTIVYCAGEFGRTPKVNQRAGRDHWARSLSVVLAGGGFKKGYAHGTTDAQGMAPATEPCTPDDVAATIFHAMGIDPMHELQTPTGRPIALFREGRVIDKLLS